VFRKRVREEKKSLVEGRFGAGAIEWDVNRQAKLQAPVCSENQASFLEETFGAEERPRLGRELGPILNFLRHEAELQSFHNFRTCVV
jgi:hypothetical protein